MQKSWQKQGKKADFGKNDPFGNGKYSKTTSGLENDNAQKLQKSRRMSVVY